jgi:thiol:disulfide interchange protein DsbC
MRPSTLCSGGPILYGQTGDRLTRWVRRWCWTACLGLLHPAYAVQPVDTIRSAIERHTQGKVAPSAVAPTPVAGIYEVVSGQEVFYVDSTGRYAFVEGRLVDLLASRDLTADRLEALSRIDFRQLPLELAVRQVRGSGRRVLAVFEDPGCPVCRVLHKFIDQLPDVTVYRFMYPVTDPTSAPKARDAWCAPDRQAAWSRLMAGGDVAAGPACDTTGLERIVALGDRLQIQGTPTVFLANGRRLVGATPPDQFLAALDASAAQAAARPAAAPALPAPAPAPAPTPSPR